MLEIILFYSILFIGRLFPIRFVLIVECFARFSQEIILYTGGVCSPAPVLSLITCSYVCMYGGGMGQAGEVVTLIAQCLRVL